MKAELERLIELFATWATEAKDHAERFARSGDDADAYADCAAELRKLLTASDWIPVSERLPERLAEVWITLENGAVERAYYAPEYGFFWSLNSQLANVVAWKLYHKPAPYRAEGGGG